MSAAPPLTGQAALKAAVVRLAAAGVEAPARDARLLLAKAMEIAPDRLSLHEREGLLPAAQARFDALVSARAARQPMGQLLGVRLFWGRPFKVTPDVLDPRPESETLISAALAGPAPRRILDLGTGSGCLLLTLLAEWPGAEGLGIDRSPAALAVAGENAESLGLAGRAHFALSDWFDDVPGRFDLIVSNPPYIAAAEMATLAPELRLWEPEMALSPGGDGLAAYRAIAAGALAHLAPGGRMLLEIGWTQHAAVAAILTAAGLTALQGHKDLDGRDRVVAARGGD